MTDPAEEPSTTVARLVELQRIDTAADQLSNRRDRLPERDQLTAATAELNEWERVRSSMRARLDELTEIIERAETDGAKLASHKKRLEAQLKTVIAPREAEALMHEIATIDEETDLVDTAELEALEEQAELDDVLTAHLGNEAAVRDATAAADAVLAQVTGDIDRELAALGTQRATARGELADDVLARYDRIRSTSGIAVATLTGHRCEGCHLDLSAAEVDDVKDEAAGAGGLAHCPQCGRMLAL
jgi:predicted  nucleic acid-binding Zn-ribbon protein